MVTGMQVPDELRYTSDHEWAKVEGAVVRVGITDYAQDALGDVVFIDLPTPGKTVTAGGTLGEVESTKSVSELYAPVSGTVIEVNEPLANEPERLNQDPYGNGWICLVEASDLGELERLLDADGYRALTESA